MLAAREIYNPTLFPETTSIYTSDRKFMPQNISKAKNSQKSPIFSPFNLALHFIMSQNLLYLFHPNQGLSVSYLTIPYISSFVLEKAYLFCNKVFCKAQKMNILSHTLYIFTAPMILWLHASTKYLRLMLIFTHHSESCELV